MRSIPITLKDSLQQPATTFTRLIKITLHTGQSYGLCMSNKDVVYDDGGGPLTYRATQGFDPSMLSTDSNYSVDNSNITALLSDDVEEITTEMAEAGALDDAKWVCYYVDYNNLAPQSGMILDAGDIGVVTTQGGMVMISEMLSYMTRLRQNIGSVDSRTCRADFGTPAESQKGCGVAIQWFNFTVTAVGDESDRTFTISASGTLPNFYPGAVQFLTGQNVGRQYALESWDGTNVIVSLLDTVPYPVQVGDTGQIRTDCDKTETMCRSYNNFINMKAETLIPVGDANAVQTPGAQI